MGSFKNPIVAPKPAIRRGYGVKTEVISVSLHKSVVKMLDEYLIQEEVQRSYFVQECIKRGLEQFKNCGFVYVIKWGEKDFEGNTIVKIGKSKNPTERLSQLAGGDGTQLPVRLELLHSIECDNMKKVETLLHRHFAHKRIDNTEYFKLQDEDIKWFLAGGYIDLRGISQYVVF
jgi:Meiotically up-regulated gene 113